MLKFFCVGGLVLAAVAGAGLAQSQRFEVASVKQSAAGAGVGSMDGGPLPPGPFNMGNHDPGRITWTNVRLIRALMLAYDLPADRISGPAWLGTEMYDIVATVPKDTTVADFKAMVRNLLAERFQLTLHRGTKEVAGYSLEVAKGGLKIRESKAVPQQAVAGKAIDGQSNALMIVDDSGFPAPRAGNAVYVPGRRFLSDDQGK